MPDKPLAIYIEDDPNSLFTMQDLIFPAYLPEFELLTFDSSCGYQNFLSELPRVPTLAILDLYLGNCPTGDVIMEWMSEQPGYEQTVIVAFTADSLLEGEELRKRGFDAVITKPMDNAQRFAELLRSALAGEKFHH